MLSQDYLSLRLIRLKSPEQWAHNGAELAFVFPQGGSGILVPASVESKLMPGDVLVLHGAFRGRISSEEATEMAFWFFSANVEHLFPLFGCSEVSMLQGVAETFKSPKIYPALSPLALECHKLLAEVPPRFDLEHRGQLLRIVAGILSAEFKNLRPPREGFVGMEDHINQVFEKMSFSEILSLSVGELAAKFSCSRRHLNRLFHHHFGLSVAAMRMEMRLLKAVSLLKDPTAKIINVAEECGFNHLGLFNTCFKRRFGLSPGHWRKAPPASGAHHVPSFAEGSAACRLHAIGLCPWAGKPITDTAPPPPPPETSPEPPPETLPPNGSADRPKRRQTNRAPGSRKDGKAARSRPKPRFQIDP